ncbi:hypothetical protein [Burkholderia sp. BCC1972]|uniref:hypothetical protein n=1 Tax=Burkholderia sp. BCC1972 TaxID=2817438 RepID=UPI002ABD5FE2|nr:hypothetical protein [Burkholderia sp. BCC1972]
MLDFVTSWAWLTSERQRKKDKTAIPRPLSRPVTVDNAYTSITRTFGRIDAAFADNIHLKTGVNPDLVRKWRKSGMAPDLYL